MRKHSAPETVEHRLKRIEAKLTQLMLHMGMDNTVQKIYYTDEHGNKLITKEVHNHEI